MEDGDTYLEDAATGKKYLFKSAEGIELKKEVYMPDSESAFPFFGYFH